MSPIILRGHLEQGDTHCYNCCVWPSIKPLILVNLLRTAINRGLSVRDQAPYHNEDIERRSDLEASRHRQGPYEGAASYITLCLVHNRTNLSMMGFPTESHFNQQLLSKNSWWSHYWQNIQHYWRSPLKIRIFRGAKMFSRHLIGKLSTCHWIHFFRIDTKFFDGFADYRWIYLSLIR